MTHVVFVTQLLDPRDPALGFASRWIEALAARADGVTVIANETHGALPGVRVVSLGKERGASRLQRALAYERALLDAPRHAAVFAHMCPSYLVAAAPVAKVRGMHSLLWFAHPSVTPTLRVAERIADVILTSLPGSYPRPGGKVRVIGQAIDTDALAFVPRAIDAAAPHLIAIGRTSPSKGFDTVIRAVASLRAQGLAAELRIVGPSTTGAERRHRIELGKLAADLGVTSAVSLEDGVEPGAVAGVIAEADLLVNAMVAGSGDKVVFEALALGRPAVASNPALSGLLGGAGAKLAFRVGDTEDLAATIANLVRSPDLTPVLRTLRERVERDHSLGRWADEVMSAAAGR